MTIRRHRGGPQPNRPLVALQHRVRAWLEDHELHAAARAEARAQAPLLPGERLLAVARGSRGCLLAATNWALYYRASQVWTRLGWEAVGRVHWYAQEHILVLTGLTPAAAARTVLPLSRDWGMPALVAERVSWAKVFDQRISLGGRAGARVIAYRLPGDALAGWLVILDSGLDPADSRITAELRSALTELRALTGIEVTAGSEPGFARPRGDPSPGAASNTRRVSYQVVCSPGPDSRGC